MAATSRDSWLARESGQCGTAPVRSKSPVDIPTPLNFIFFVPIQPSVVPRLLILWFHWYNVVPQSLVSGSTVCGVVNVVQTSI